MLQEFIGKKFDVIDCKKYLSSDLYLLVAKVLPILYSCEE